MAADIRALKSMAFRRFLAAFLVLGLLMFLPAGTLRFWPGWIYLALVLVPMSLVLRYLLRNDPALLERRLKMKEQEKEQQAIQVIGVPLYLALFLLPGLDHRFGWSTVPVSVVIVSELLVLAGYLFVFLVFRENSYAARVVEVGAEQRLVTSGPYALVRHPMYLGVSLMFLATPTALGSWWALLSAVPIVVLLMFRIGNEEDVLCRDLPGYEAYRRSTRHRLIPGLW